MGSEWGLRADGVVQACGQEQGTRERPGPPRWRLSPICFLASTSVAERSPQQCPQSPKLLVSRPVTRAPQGPLQAALPPLGTSL